VGYNGLIAKSIFGPIVHPFGQLYVYRFGRKESYAQPAKNYFDNIGTGRADRYPPDFYGNCVDALGGFMRWTPIVRQPEPFFKV
jgi:hypothetical protein